MADNNNRNYNNRNRNNNQQRRQRVYEEDRRGNNYQDDYDEDYRDDQRQMERSPRNRQQRGNGNNHQQSRQRRYDDDYDNYQPQYRQSSNKKPLLIGLGALGAVAVAAGLFSFLSGNSTAQIVSVSPNYVSTQQPYQDCHKVGTTRYVRNQKNGTEGALIGGATGAVAGGIIGNQVKQGGGGTAVGAVVGGATGALVGREVQRSNQPDYVAQKGSTTQCATRYKTVQTQVGYNVQYLYKGNMASMVTQSAPAIGVKLPYSQLQAMAMPASPPPVAN